MDRTPEWVELLLTNPIFATLAEMDARALYGAGTLRRLTKGDLLFWQGEAPNGFYLVLEGRFSVACDGEDGPVRIATIERGETVGEMGLVQASTRSASCAALDRALVWHLPGEVFEGLLLRGDPIAASILRGVGKDLCRRFRAAVDEGTRLVGALHDGERIVVDTLGWEV